MLGSRRFALLALLAVVPACTDPASSASATGPVDAGADVHVSPPVPCRGGAARGTPVGGPLEGGVNQFVGAVSGRLYWTDAQNQLWSMSQDGGYRRINYRAEPNAFLRMGPGAIYAQLPTATGFSTIRVPLDGSAPSAVLNDQLLLFASDADNFYARSMAIQSTGSLIHRIPKAGGPSVVLAPFPTSGEAKLGGTKLWLNSLDGLGWIDALGGPLPNVNMLATGCGSSLVSETHAVCTRDGTLRLVPVDGPSQTLLDRPLPAVAGPEPVPRLFLRRGGEDGVLFDAPVYGVPASLNWVSLKGGAPIELTCTDNYAAIASDGDSLFLIDSNTMTDGTTRTGFARVDLR